MALMIVNYKKSNSYTRKQSKTLILGIGAGILLYIAMSVIPNIYLVQNGQIEREAFVEVSMSPTETMLGSLPLLLFSGISIAIIFALLHPLSPGGLFLGITEEILTILICRSYVFYKKYI